MCHIWPDELTPSSYCQACGLRYDEWSEGDNWCDQDLHPRDLILEVM